MSDIELVIKIPEDVYKRTIFYREFKDLNDCITTIKALEKGTPLPEHHGRLIDADKIMRVDHIVLESAIDNAPTIIEGSESE